MDLHGSQACRLELLNQPVQVRKHAGVSERRQGAYPDQHLDRLDGCKLHPLHISGPVPPYVAVKGLLEGRDVALLDQHLSDVRTSHRPFTREFRYPVPRDIHSHVAQLHHHPPASIPAGAAEIRQGALEIRILIVQEIAQHVHLSAGYIRAHLNPGDQGEVGVLLRRQPCLGESLCGIVVGDGEDSQACLGRQIDKLRRRETAI